MRHLANKLLFACLALFSLPAAATPLIKDIDIMVQLQDNGDAEIIETRNMYVDGTFTEAYIVIGNLEGSQITDFYVTDEKGVKYTVEPNWDTKRSNAAKANRCGILSKSNGGFELCWGLGDTGDRVYTIHYRVSALLRGYQEADGFNYMFVAPNTKPTPQHAKVTIQFPELQDANYTENLRVWAFGFDGDVENYDGEVVAESDGSLANGAGIIVMAGLKKGIMHPAMTENVTFDSIKNKAFEGSDYDSDEGSSLSFWEKVKAFFGVLFGAFILLVPVYVKWNKWNERRKVTKDLDWYRDIPYDGNLLTANSVISAYESNKNGFDHLLSAMVLRLLRTKALRIEEHFLDASKMKKMFGGKGKVEECIVIGDFEEDNKLINTQPIRKLYDIFTQAAGEDKILQPTELKKWMLKNQKETTAFLKLLDKHVSLKECRNNITEVRQLFGLRMFLKDFTLANERSISEVGLWKDYLIYAELFGIADQVTKDMKKLNPEFMQMDDICKTLTNKTALPALTSATLFGSRSVQRMSRSSGGGGRSSFGGGGGFRGGGSGGGMR